MTRLTAYAKHICSLVPASLLTIKKSSLMLGLFFLTALYVPAASETVVVGLPNTLDTLHAQNPALYPGQSMFSSVEIPTAPGSGNLYFAVPEIDLATGEKIGTRYYAATPSFPLEYDGPGMTYMRAATSRVLHGTIIVTADSDAPSMAPVYNTGNMTAISGFVGPTYDSTTIPIYNGRNIGEIAVDFVLNRVNSFDQYPEYFVHNNGTISSLSSRFIAAQAEQHLILNTGNIPVLTSVFLGNGTDSGALIYNTGFISTLASDFYKNYSTLFENEPYGDVGDIIGDFVENSAPTLIVNNSGGFIGNIPGNFVGNQVSHALIDNATDGDLQYISGHFLENTTDNTLINNGDGTYVLIGDSIFIDNTGPYLMVNDYDGQANLHDSYAYYSADFSGTRPNVLNNGALGFFDTYMDTTVENNGEFWIQNGWVSGISGTGITNIMGDIDFTATTVTGNTVNVNSDTLTVASTTFDNTVTLNVYYGGTVDIAENAVTVQDATFASGSTLALKINAADDHGLFSANTITVEDGRANLQVTFAHGIAVPTDIQLLSATGSTDFNNFTDVFDNNMYRFIKKDLNGWYTVLRTKTAEEISRENDGTMENQTAAAAWVDGPAFPGGSAVADDLADLAQNDPIEFNKALTALAPTDAPVAQAVATHQQDVLLHTVSSHLRDERPCFTPEEGLQLWVRGYGGKAKLSKIRNHYGFDMKNYGGILGVGKALENGTVGMGIQYDQSDIDGFRRNTDAQTHTMFAYGEYKPGDWYVNGLLSYGISNYHEKKLVSGDIYKAHWHARSYGARLLTGYDGDLLNPEVEARYQHLQAEKYTDGLKQHVGSEGMDILTLRAGLRKSWLFGCARFIKPEIYVGAEYDVISDRENGLVSLDNGTTYHVYGQRLDRLSAQASVGVSVELTEHLWAHVNYLGQLRKDYHEHTGIAGLTYWF